MVVQRVRPGTANIVAPGKEPRVQTELRKPRSSQIDHANVGPKPDDSQAPGFDLGKGDDPPTGVTQKDFCEAAGES
jgi:hypothetical protein